MLAPCKSIRRDAEPTAVAVVRAALPEAQARLRGIVIWRLNGDRFTADDVLQRFALRAIERAAELRQPERVEAWLSRVLATTLADHARETARRREDVEDPHVLAQAALIEEPQKPEACACVEPMLGTLRPEPAELIRRIDLQDEPVEQVARDLGILPNALYVRLHRARRALATLVLQACSSCPVEGFLYCSCPSPGRHDAPQQPTAG